VATGFHRIALVDPHRMDRVMRKGTDNKKRSKNSRKRAGKTAARSSHESVRGISASDKSSNARMLIEAAIRKIPCGSVSTYGAIARAAGLPGMARQVAQVLHRGFNLPWQRVLGSGGVIRLRGDSAIEQRLRLEAEGVRFRGRKVDMKQHEFKFNRTSSYPRSGSQANAFPQV
jgi:methylated-DNA-protein-cysteine methyltransferase-like protein